MSKIGSASCSLIKSWGTKGSPTMLESGKQGTVHIEQVLGVQPGSVVSTRRPSLQTDDRGPEPLDQEFLV